MNTVPCAKDFPLGSLQHTISPVEPAALVLDEHCSWRISGDWNTQRIVFRKLE